MKKNSFPQMMNRTRPSSHCQKFSLLRVVHESKWKNNKNDEENELPLVSMTAITNLVE